MPEEPSTDREDVEQLLEDRFGDRIYTVEDGVVWVSGMNANCRDLAERMAHKLATGVGVRTSSVRGDGAAQFGGVQFRWGPSA